jgi:hypothetical protein
LNDQNKRILDELVEAYHNSSNLYSRSENAWEEWVTGNLNDDDNNPRHTSENSEYSLECYFSYSPSGIAFAILIPFIISVVAGITYQAKTGDVRLQTAWSIASYIVTAAAGKWLFHDNERQPPFLQFSNTMLAALIAILGLNDQLSGKKDDEN